MAQKVINLNTSQIAHGRFDVEYDDKDVLVEETHTVVVGYTPSMIRMILVGENGNPTCRVYWYSTDPLNVFIDLADADEDNIFEESPITVNERGFVVDLTDDLLEDVVEVIWETFGHDPQDAETPDEDQVWNMPGADDDDDEYGEYGEYL